MTVFVILWYNYGDQGVDFSGVYGTREAAGQAIIAREPDPHEQQYYRIVESEVRDGSFPASSWLDN